MHIRLIAVGDRQPSWVDDAFAAYCGRFPAQWKFRLDVVATARRARNDKSKRAVEAEGESILGRLGTADRMVLLDERGTQLTSESLAARLSDWHCDGRDLCFVIGGPDGVSDTCRGRADFVWSLSGLTLPHGLVRVLLAEQLYRAWSLQCGHPYHRA